MAVQTGMITLSGKLGNQVYYKRRGKNLVRRAASTHKLSRSSKKAQQSSATPPGPHH